MTVVYRPAPPLDQYIECLWYQDLRAPYQRERILPTGTLELMINFGTPFRLYDSMQAQQFTQYTDGWIVGLHTTYLLNELLGNSHLIGVRFKPGGIHPFFTLPASELHNRVVPLELLWGGFFHELRERLLAAPDTTARFALLERVLLTRWHAAQHSAPTDAWAVMQYAVRQMALSHGALNIRALSDQIGISQKHLITCFRRMVGVPPKTLARIYRFQHVLHSIDPVQTVDWAQIALSAQYYDQSHFNHDFAAFTGLNPTAYLQMRQQVFGDSLRAGQDVHFVPCD